jgi:hypothetical protein
MAPTSDPMNDKSTPNLSKPSDHTWKYSEKLGEGSEGTVHLWNLLDDTQNIVERIVIKNLEVSDSQFIQEGPAKGQLLQVYLQQKLDQMEAKDGDDAEDADEDDTTASSSIAAGTKRKSTAPLPPAKRPRFTGALQRRLQLVAAQMKGARPSKINKADQDFVLADKHKITLSDDKCFNSCDFFECPDPKHIEFRDVAPLTSTSIDPVVLRTRATSAPPISSGATTRGVHYFALGDNFTLQTTQARYQAAFNHRYSATPDPTTISSMDWSPERTRFLYHQRRATNLHERMYWLSRSIQAEYYARGDYVNGRGSDLYIGLAILNWNMHRGEPA